MAGNEAKPWSQQEIELLLSMRANKTLTEIWQEFSKRGFNRTRKGIEHKCHNMGIFYQIARDTATVAQVTIAPGQTVEIEIVDETTEQTNEDDVYEQTWNRIRQMKHKYITDYEHAITGLTRGNARKILCLSDFHIPFERDDLIWGIVKEHQDADILVLNGDLLDLYAVSTWPKEKSVPLRKEYQIAMEYLKSFSKIFKQVILTRGNHEYRLNRYFYSNVSPAVSFMVSKEILARLARGEVYTDEGEIAELLNFKNITYVGGGEPWYFKIGKTIFCHPQSFSSVEAKTSVNAQRYFMERTDIDCVVTAHTHKQSFLPTRNKLCIEQGCLCTPLDYEKQGKLTYSAMVLGYTIVYQDAEGNCDFNRTRNVYLGTQYPIKGSYDEIATEE